LSQLILSENLHPILISIQDLVREEAKTDLMVVMDLPAEDKIVERTDGTRYQTMLMDLADNREYCMEFLKI
jgi:hypothetical protein